MTHPTPTVGPDRAQVITAWIALAVIAALVVGAAVAAWALLTIDPPGRLGSEPAPTSTSTIPQEMTQ